MAKEPKNSKPKGVRYARVSVPEIPKWTVKANHDLPDDLYYGGGKEFSFRKPVWLNNVGHGAWDDEEPGPNEKNLTTSEAGQGEAHKFLGMMANLFMHRWPPVWELMFIDYTGRARKLALHLIGIMDSPDGTPFPRMDKGFLNLGPDLALNGCELVLLTQEQRDTFGQVLEKLCVRLRQWFPNNKKGLTSSRGLKAILKTDVEKTRPPQAMHIYSCKLYAERCLREKVIAEVARTGESPNNIAVISQMTNVEWKKEAPEVRAETMSIQSEQRKLVEAVKAHHYDKINFPPGQKKQAIESLGGKFKKMFKLFQAITGWGFVIVGAGIDPGSPQHS
ncbi:uncharacterized protein EV420DRAFT_1485646 [Desarmillaria tabescens]|uniref:Uncharacterized protein n=1 Tax=Armillaria tabescens TaxID=1929756 RepID=A0AA39MNQ8_ARMTA|nr:uncharacterized protein EV420DRAFT_1485646 [Desarmillaria tabescens]KAK0441481.1 hypothetical protein EV420DRAFT_1485646 [Desarmillaria tabescens]